MSRSSWEGPNRDVEGLDLFDLVVPLKQRARLLVIIPLVAGLAALGLTFLMKPVFTAKTVFIPPKQQGSAATALAAVGALSSLAGGFSAGVQTPADQYVSLMQTDVVADRVIDRFKLMEIYGARLRVDARNSLFGNVRFNIGKKDGLVTVEVDDESASRAADIANQFIQELRQLTDRLALTEAQQRRAFFEKQLAQTRDRLIAAQLALQGSGVSEATLKAEPKAATEGYARLREELISEELRLQAMRQTLAEGTPEVKRQEAVLAALRSQLAKAESGTNVDKSSDYVTKYREFKYQETLFDMFARQYELAKLDESRDSTIVEVVDPATPPERKSKPNRRLVALITTITTFIALAVFFEIRHFWRQGTARREAASS